MEYSAKNYESLLGTKGFSDVLLKNHFTLYQGYVANTNKIAAILSSMAKEGKTGTPEFAELKRRFGWEFSGMRLHEHYFENIIKGGRMFDKNSALLPQISSDFGSFDEFVKEFKATGTIRGIGWVVLYWDKQAKRLFVTWISEHDCGHLTGAAPILVMDVFEHAYLTDYGLKRIDYIDSFFNNIDWENASKRLTSEF